MLAQPTRLPRFRRASESIEPMNLTSRDLDILRLVGRYRFVNAPSICSAILGNDQQIRRRLRLLFHHGYLERPMAQLDTYYQSGSRPMIYGLGSKGAALLRSQCDIAISQIDWSAKNRAVKRIFLNHTVMVSKIMCDIEATCMNTDDVDFISQHDLTKEAGRTSPFEWKVEVDGEKIGVVPDQTFAVRGGRLRETRYFFLEADCGTMPVVRHSNSRRSSIDRKAYAYSNTWRQKLHRQLFGFNRFRVLIVSSGEERIARINNHLLQKVGTPGLFLLLSEEANSKEPSSFLFSKSQT